MATENTYKNLSKDDKAAAVRGEMLPFLLYAAIPILITIAIAFIFGPSLT
jgi:Na+/melibiose symporter-like transporter